MMAVKRSMKMLLSITVVLGIMLFGTMSHADTYTQSIHLTVRVLGSLSINIEEEWLNTDSSDLSAEAYTELDAQDVSINLTKRGDNTIIVFTKTE